MYYEITIKVAQTDKRGNEKEVKEQYLVQNVDLFAEAEMKGIDLTDNEGDVVAIKRSPIIEVINEKEEESMKYYKAKIASIFIDDNGNEKETNYQVLCAAHNLDEANNRVKDYMKQGMNDLVLKAITETKFLEII